MGPVFEVNQWIQIPKVITLDKSFNFFETKFSLAKWWLYHDVLKIAWIENPRYVINLQAELFRTYSRSRESSGREEKQDSLSGRDSEETAPPWKWSLSARLLFSGIWADSSLCLESFFLVLLHSTPYSGFCSNVTSEKLLQYLVLYSALFFSSFHVMLCWILTCFLHVK